MKTTLLIMIVFNSLVIMLVVLYLVYKRITVRLVGFRRMLCFVMIRQQCRGQDLVIENFNRLENNTFKVVRQYRHQINLILIILSTSKNAKRMLIYRSKEISITKMGKMKLK